MLLLLEAAIGIEPMNKGFAEIICGHPPVNTEEQGRAKFNSLRFVMFFLGRLCMQVFTTFFTTVNPSWIRMRTREMRLALAHFHQYG